MGLRRVCAGGKLRHAVALDGRAVGADPPGDNLDLHIGQAQAVLGLVRGLEGFAHGIDILLAGRVAVKIDGDLVLLACIAHVCPVDVVDLVRRAARGFQRDPGFGGHFGIGFPRLFPVDPAGGATREVEPHRRDQRAEGRQNAGERGIDDGGAFQQFSHMTGMHRACAAKSQHRHAAIVDAAVGGMRPGRSGHGFVDHLENPAGGLLDRGAELVGQRLDCGLGGGFVELHIAAEEVIGIQQAEDEIGIGHRRVFAATPVTGGAGL